MENKDQSLIKYWPLLGALLVAFGAEYLIFYYAVFNIPIMDFIEWGEIIQSFFSHIVVFIFLFLLGAFQVFIIQGKHEVEKERKVYTLEFSKQPFWKRLISYFRQYSVFFWITFGSLSVDFLSAHFKILESKSTWLDSIKYYVGAMVLVVILNEIRIKIDNHNYSNSQRFFFISVLFLLASFISIAYFAEREAKSLIESEERYIATIETKSNTTIKSTRTNIYVGKTKSFIFFFDVPTKKATLYPADEIKQLTLEIDKNSN